MESLPKNVCLGSLRECRRLAIQRKSLWKTSTQSVLWKAASKKRSHWTPNGRPIRPLSLGVWSPFHYHIKFIILTSNTHRVTQTVLSGFFSGRFHWFHFKWFLRKPFCQNGSLEATSFRPPEARTSRDVNWAHFDHFDLEPKNCQKTNHFKQWLGRNSDLR